MYRLLNSNMLVESVKIRFKGYEIKDTSSNIKRHTNIQPEKPTCFPYTKKQSPDQTKSRAHQIMFR